VRRSGRNGRKVPKMRNMRAVMKVARLKGASIILKGKPGL
jgi:hypothetical protein